MAKSKLVKANQKIAENVIGGYKAIEDGVVGGYKKIEDGVVGGFTKIADTFVDQFLTKDGESIEDAKKRIAAEQGDRKNAGHQTAASDIGKASVEASLETARASVEASKNAGKRS